MSCVYARGKSLWIAYKDERGVRVCRPSGYKVGEEAAAEAVAAELDRKAAAVHGPRLAPKVEVTADVATPPLLEMPTVLAEAGPQPLQPLTVSPLNGPVAITVREYGERWIKTRDHVETVADEIGRLRNHIFPALGDLKMREVRPRHVRDFIVALKKANLHKRGLGKGYAKEKIAPRTVRHIYGLLRRMFNAAVIDEVIEFNPVTLPPDVLPKNVDKDPAWRATALYERHELVQIISAPVIPPDRRIINAIKGLGGTRHGEAAGVRWNNYLREAQPLKKLVIARSYNKDGTKTKVPRMVPVHPVLEQLLEEWWDSGWGALYGRAPRLDDYIVPRSIDGDRTHGDEEDDTDEGIEHDDLWPADQVNKLFHADLDALGIRRRRGHDLRRTFITLAREDGARRDVLEVITHAPNASDMMSLYTSFSWPTLCAEVAKLQISLPERHAPHAVPTRSDTSVERDVIAGGRQRQAPGGDATPAHPARQPAVAELVAEATPGDRRPMERGQVSAPVPAELNGARRSFGGITVAASRECSATGHATCSAESPVISSRCPGLNRGPTVYETVALPLSYSGR
jgi:integrase